MRVEFIKQLHRDSLEKAWNARPAKDPMLKRRQKVLDRIDAALAQLKRGETNPPRGDYQTREKFDGVRVQLKYGQRALTIDGRDHWFVEDAATFFSSAREAVEKGELDGAISNVFEAGNKAREEARERGRDTADNMADAKADAETDAEIEVKATADAEADAEPMLAPAAPPSEPLHADDVAAVEAEPEGTASADERQAAKPGKFARKYEKMLAAGMFSQPAL